MNRMFNLLKYTFLIMLLPHFFQPLLGQNRHRDYRNPDIEQSRYYLSGNSYQKDFLLFMNMLETTHPAFSPQYIPPFNIDSITHNGYIELENCSSLSQFTSYMQSIGALLHDGHTYVLPDFDRQLLYPVQLFIGQDQVCLYLVDKAYKKYLGKTITQINYQPVFMVIQSFLKNISWDNEYFGLEQVSDYMMFYSQWMHNPYLRSDSSLILTFENGDTLLFKPGILNLNNMVKYTVYHNTITQPQKKLFFYTILKEKSICYFQFNQCVDQGTLRYQKYVSGEKTNKEMEQQLLKIPRFDTLVASMFKQIKAQNIKTLVVDVRDNSGGNSKLCDILLSYLKPVSTMKTFHSYIRVSSLFQAIYPLQYDKMLKNIELSGKQFGIGNLYEDEFDDIVFKISVAEKKMLKYFNYNKNPKNIFNGNIVFIQSKKTYSSAGLLIIEAMDNSIGKVIGTKSSFKPCSFGDVLNWELPNTKLRGGISHKIFNRPDESKCDEKYIMPHILIEQQLDDLQNNNDKCWEWIIEHYGK